MADQFKKTLSGVAIDPEIPTERESLDYRAVLQRIRLARPDALFFVLYPEDAARLLRQSAEMGLRLPMLATATFEDPKLLSVPGADRVVFASPVPPDNASPERARFLQDYKAAFGEDAGVLSDTGYDSAMILIKAWAAVGDKGVEAVAQYIRSLRSYPGVSGEMTFDERGDVQKPYRLRTVKGGKFDWL
jgi:branched-chain amino acid transport system substrate-binding protein